ncbi:CHAT domain-containing protein [Nonomuraea sp. NPDC003201]
MAFDILLALMHRRLDTLEQTQDPELVLGGSALAEATGLRDAAQSVDPQRKCVAAYALAWFYFYRHNMIPPGPESSAELAHAIVVLMPVAHDSNAIPEPLKAVIGPAGDPQTMGRVGVGLLTAALGSPESDVLEACVFLLAKAARLDPDPQVVAHLAVAHLVRYERGGPPGDLDHSVEHNEHALALTQAGHPDRIGRLTNLGNALRERFARDGNPADLERAIDVGEQAVSMADHHPNLVAAMGNLGNCYLERNDLIGSLTDLDRAIELIERSVALTPDAGFDRSGQLANLCGAYLGRYDETDSLTDLDQAIRTGEEAIASTPESHPNQPGWLTNLSNAYQKRHSRRGAHADLDRAIETAEQALRFIPRSSPNRGAALSACGLAYKRRYRDSGVPADLLRAFELAKEALAVTPDGGAHRTKFLSNLSDVYGERYRSGGSLADLDHAIALAEKVIAATPTDHPSQASDLSRLGNAHRERFRRNGVTADLNRAIELLERSVAIRTGTDTAAYAGLLSNLGLFYQERYIRDSAVADLDRAVELAELAIAAFPTDHPERYGVVSSVGLIYQRRYRHSGEVADLDRAISLGEQAAAGLPESHPERGAVWSDLGLAYFQRFKRTEDLTDLDLAVHAGEQAVACTAEDHPYRARYLSNLADAYWYRLNVDKRGLLEETITQICADVRTATASSPTDRVLAGHFAGVLAGVMRDNAAAVELLDTAVGLLPSTAPREGVRADQEHGLSEHTGVVSDAIAAHCARRDPVRAVEVAELGRGILLGADLDSRTDLTELERAHPGLAEGFRRLRDQLQIEHTMSNTIQYVENRKRLWAEQDALLAEIRQQPRFARFLLPPRFSDLRVDSTVVLINAGILRSDAIIITAGGDPLLVPLPLLKVPDVRAKAQELLDATADHSRLAGPLKRQRVVREILSWLWTSALEPILAALGPSGMPRVCWLPTGSLGLFPLHAAGNPGEPGALDYVVSSYTPTLRALAYVRTRPASAKHRQLTVALEQTPGLPDLPGCVTEAAALHRDHPDTPPLTDKNATTELVRAALTDATWMHFACHARSDLTKPSQGGLRLYDGTLAIPEISKLRLDHAELAYLSACSTAHRGTQLADEAIHLASAFQLAGFRHVVASLWPLADDVAATAAHSFYGHLGGTADHAAVALHRVAHELRAEYPDRADLWAPLIHSGP